MVKRWRNRYRITAAPGYAGERRLACGICGHGQLFTEPGVVLLDHCISYDTEAEAREYQHRKYQLIFVETLDPVSGNFDRDNPELGRQGWK